MGHPGGMSFSPRNPVRAERPSPQGYSDVQRRNRVRGPEPAAHPLNQLADICAAPLPQGRARQLLPRSAAAPRQVSNIVAGYGAHDEVLKGVGITVAERELVVLIGPNGAGKSTLLKSIAGFLKPREGAITLRGQADRRPRPARSPGRASRSCRRRRTCFPRSPSRRTSKWAAMSTAAPPKSACKGAFARFPVLAERRAQEARTLSGGQRQMLAMAMALMAAPRLMLLDEPSAGLSPAASAELFALVKGLHAEGMTVIMVEQNALDALADCGSRLSAGRWLERARGPRARARGGRGGPARIPWGLIAAIIRPTTTGGSHVEHTFSDHAPHGAAHRRRRDRGAVRHHVAGLWPNRADQARGPRVAHRLGLTVRTEQPHRAIRPSSIR